MGREADIAGRVSKEAQTTIHINIHSSSENELLGFKGPLVSVSKEDFEHNQLRSQLSPSPNWLQLDDIYILLYILFEVYIL